MLFSPPRLLACCCVSMTFAVRRRHRLESALVEVAMTERCEIRPRFFGVTNVLA